MKKAVKSIFKWMFAAVFAFTAAASVCLTFGISRLEEKGLYSDDYMSVQDSLYDSVDFYLASCALNASIHPEGENLSALYDNINRQGLEFAVVARENEEASVERDPASPEVIYIVNGVRQMRNSALDGYVLYRTTGFTESESTENLYRTENDRYLFFSGAADDFQDLRITDVIEGMATWMSYEDSSNGDSNEKLEEAAAADTSLTYYIYYHNSSSMPVSGVFVQADEMASQITSFCGPAATIAVVFAGVSLLALVAAVLLSGSEETICHRIPYIILLALTFCGVTACTLVAKGIAEAFLNNEFFVCLKLLFIPAAAAAFICMGLFIQTVERIKCRTFYKNTFIRRIVDLMALLIGNVPLFLTVVLGFVVVTIVQMIGLALASNSEADLVVAGLLLYKIVEVVLLALFVIHATRISDGITKVSSGVFDSPVNTSGMTGLFRKAATELNGIGSSLNVAVEERMKSERMKAELITNVSHDIKTPLTSIINYVDLLKGEPAGNEKAAEYIEVIDRHSQRLKKLTEDLIEASKASTGNIEVHPEDIDAKVFLSQIAGEFEERLAKNGLTLVANYPEEDVLVKADGRCLWRIIENLMVNISKYAMNGTRVYTDLTCSGKEVMFSFKNISGESLNISADELKARFVRGDRSRNTEGSGLGLSIAEDLATLMGGRLDITIDGDLFKVTVTLPKGERIKDN